ncbi:uncharacterized protein LOC127736701 [Mytilus californianus]|uniref:uncharacterized protein LOC127736701 n=1 Tax=Mytilus californianus TaxID=6549 RepID=UPI0022473F53|nr:uncharacterized protein LOC127736701 [Mytilus californianus]
MDRDDRRRYFIVGSVIVEIVTPAFRQRLENDYKSKGLGCLQDFINSKPVIHILFHLRHKNTQCCVDSTNCVNHGPLPLNHSQWDLLYTGPPNHHCFCKFTAKPVTLDELDITLASLILLNCCTLSVNERFYVSKLREFKNNYLSHNANGTITQAEYTTLIGDLQTLVLKLDPSKQDDFARIQNRALDEPLCNKYFTSLLDIYGLLEKIGNKVENVDTSTTRILTTVNSNAQILATMGISNDALIAKIEDLLQNMICQRCKEMINNQEKENSNKPYKLGNSIFTLHHEINLTSIVSDGLVGYVSDMMMMDDGRIVICLHNQSRLLICNTDGSQADSIPVQSFPLCVTAVNNSTVAVVLYSSICIEMYDINNKLKLKSISLPGMCWVSCITTINNKLVVGGYDRLQIIDHQTGEVVQTIKTDCSPYRLHCSGDRIFYCGNNYNNNKLYRYSYTDDRHHTLTLPSPPYRMTTLQDGSLYVGCEDGSVQHVSSDGKQYKTVTTEDQKKLKFHSMSYNSKQRKLVTTYASKNQTLTFKVFYEK